MDIWFAPIAGTRFLAPFRISLPTVIGMAVLQADQFLTYPVPGARPTAARSQ
jgi:membrane protein DedA with SNARE-associated domain